MDARQFASVAKIEKIAVVEEKLGHNIIGTGIDLLLEVIHFQEPVGRGWVAFGKPRDANAKSALIRMNTRFVEFSDKSHKVDRVLKVVVGFAIFQTLRSVAAE